jgi:hypothetical protein
MLDCLAPQQAAACDCEPAYEYRPSPQYHFGYGVTRKQARVMAKIASGTSIAAAENFSVVGGNREQTIDSAVQFILGGLETFKR